MQNQGGGNPRRTRPARWVCALALLSAFALVAASCGDDDDVDASAGADTTSTSEAAAAGEGDGADADASAIDPSLEPIRIAFLSNWEIPAFGINTHDKLVAAEVAVEALNAAGGINGAEIDLFTCNIENDAPSAESCARDAVEFDPIAVAGMTTPTNGSAMAIFEEAGIPVVGGALEPSVWGSAAAYPIVNGSPGLFMGQGAALAERGVTKARFVVTDFGPAAAVPQRFFQMGAEAQGIEVLDPVAVPPDQVDMAPIVRAALADGVDGIAFLLASPPANVGFTRAVDSSGFDGVLITTDGTLTQDVIEDMVPGTLSTTLVNLNSPGGERYTSEIEEYSPESDVTPFASVGWLAINVIAELASQLDEPTADAMSALLAEQTELDLMGMANPVDFSAPVPSLAQAGVTRLFQTAVGVATIDGRRFIDGRLVEPFGS